MVAAKRPSAARIILARARLCEPILLVGHVCAYDAPPLQKSWLIEYSDSILTAGTDAPLAASKMGRLTLLTTLLASTAALQRAPLRNVAQRKAQNAAPVREQQPTGLAENLENILDPVGDVVVTALRAGT